MLAYFWNQKEKRLRAAWRLLIFVILLFVFSGIMGSIIAVAGILLMGINLGFMNVVNDPNSFAVTVSQDIAASPFINLISGIIVLFATILTLLVMSRWIDRRPLADFGFHLRKTWWRDFGFGLGLGAILMALVFTLEYVAGWLKVIGILQPSFPGAIFWEELLAGLVLFVCVGIYEEVISRSILLRTLAEGLNLSLIGPRGALVLAWVLSSIIFGGLHAINPNATLLSTLNIMLAGIFLGLGFILTGEMAVPIGLHFAWNFFQGNVFAFPVSGVNAGASLITIQQGGPDLITGGAFGPEGGLLGIAAILLGCALIAWWVRRTSGSIILKDRLAVFNPIHLDKIDH